MSYKCHICVFCVTLKDGENMKNIINIIVKDEENGSRIDSFISKKEKELSRTRIKNLILQKKLKLNNLIITNPSKKVLTGDKINLSTFFHHS